MQEKQKEAIDEWKKRTTVWKGSDAQIYRYIKNEMPAKAADIMTPTGPSSDPKDILRELNSFWARVESRGCLLCLHSDDAC